VEGFFMGLASGGKPPHQFEWAFPDDTVVQNMNATRAIDSPGTYKVKVFITDAAGQSGNHSFEIRVVPAQ
jgi:PKD repeat protein